MSGLLKFLLFGLAGVLWSAMGSAVCRRVMVDVEDILLLSQRWYIRVDVALGLMSVKDAVFCTAPPTIGWIERSTISLTFAMIAVDVLRQVSLTTDTYD